MNTSEWRKLRVATCGILFNLSMRIVHDCLVLNDVRTHMRRSLSHYSAVYLVIAETPSDFVIRLMLINRE